MILFKKCKETPPTRKEIESRSTYVPLAKNALHFACSTLFILLACSLLSLIYVGDRVQLRFNGISAISFLILLVFLLLFEKKIGYFSRIKHWIVKELRFCQSIKSSKKHYVLHLVTLVMTAAAILSVFAVLLLSHLSRVAYLAIAVLMLPTVLLQIFDQILVRKNHEPVRLFLTVALLLGLLFCYILPIYSGVTFDEQIHLSNIFSVAYPADQPFSLAEYKLFTHGYYWDCGGSSYFGYIQNPQSIAEQMIQDDSVVAEFQQTSFNPYTGLGYIPMILVVFFAQLLGIDVIKTLLLGRIANLLTYSVICYLGIRKLKRGQYLFSAVCLLPGVLFLACTPGYDFWVIAWLTFVTATILSEFQQPEKKFTAFDLTVVLLAFILGCGPKAIYFVMLTPLLFLKKDKFQSKKQHTLFKALMVAAMLFVMLMILYGGTYSGFYTDDRGGANINSIGQIQYILTHPFQYAHTLLTHLLQYFSPQNASTYMTLIGYIGSPGILCVLFSIVLLLYCILTDGIQQEPAVPMTRVRVATLLTGLVQAVLISTALYASFNAVGASTIEGCQYRYVFPYLAGVCYFLRPKNLNWNIKPAIQNAVIFCGFSLTLFFTYFEVYLIRML